MFQTPVCRQLSRMNLSDLSDLVLDPCPVEQLVIFQPAVKIIFVITYVMIASCGVLGNSLFLLTVAW